MNCSYKACLRASDCNIKDVAHNCSIHRNYLKMKGGKKPLNSYVSDGDEKTIKKYVEEIKRKHPELAYQAEQNARDIIKSINH